MADRQLQDEADAMTGLNDDMNRRADANARDQLTSASIISPEAADRAGIYDHPTLDTPVPQGLMEAWSQQAKDWDQELKETRDGLYPAEKEQVRRSAESIFDHATDVPDPPSTHDVYSREGVYDKSRKQLHEQIILDHCTGHAKHQNPVIVTITGSHADRLRDHLALSMPQDAVTVSLTALQHALPEHQRMTEQDDPNVEALTLREALDLTAAILQEAARRKQHILLIGGHIPPRSPDGYVSEAHHGTLSRHQELLEALTGPAALSEDARDQLRANHDHGRVYDMTGPFPVIIKDHDQILRPDLWENPK
jgi:hypothetical protein